MRICNSSLGLQNHELGGNLRGDLVQSPPLGRRSPKAAEDQPATLGDWKLFPVLYVAPDFSMKREKAIITTFVHMIKINTFAKDNTGETNSS